MAEAEQKSSRKRWYKDGLLVWGVPKELRDKFRVACAQKRQTMKETIIQLMQEFVAHAKS